MGTYPPNPLQPVFVIVECRGEVVNACTLRRILAARTFRARNA